MTDSTRGARQFVDVQPPSATESAMRLHIIGFSGLSSGPTNFQGQPRRYLRQKARQNGSAAAHVPAH